MLGATYNLFIQFIFAPVFSSENRPSAPIAQSAIQDQHHNYSTIEKQHDCTNNPLIQDPKNEKNMYLNIQKEFETENQVLPP